MKVKNLKSIHVMIIFTFETMPSEVGLIIFLVVFAKMYNLRILILCQMKQGIFLYKILYNVM